MAGTSVAIKPVVRYMLLCEDWRLEPENSRRITIVGLLSNIDSIEDPPYPLLYPEICIFLALTEGRGQGQGKMVCVFEESGQRVFETRPQPIAFPSDPLEVMALAFRIRDCSFPRAGLYSFQFWYEGDLVEERPLKMR